MNKAQVFRQAALDKLDAPEQLDQLVPVTDRGGWLVLVAVALLLLVAIVWAITGTLPRRVRGEGMLIRKGGVFEVVSVGAGQITRLLVQAGETVERGQVVAELAQPELEDRLAKERAKLAELRLQQSEVAVRGDATMDARRRSIREERASLRMTLQAEQKRRSSLEERAAADERLAHKGLLSTEEAIRSRHEAQQVSEAISHVQVRLRELVANERELALAEARDGLSSNLRISEQERAVRLLEERIAINSSVESRSRGRVIEIRASEGSVVLAGSPIINLEHAETGTAADRLLAVLYLPPSEGKRVHSGYAAQVAPSTIRREEFGTVRGTVTQVGDFPATRQGMLRSLRNEGLVDRFIVGSAGAPIEVEVELHQSGTMLEWSSGREPPIAIETGTLCSVEVTVERRAPIDYVLPMLERARSSE